MPDPSAALREMARVARPGAKLFLTTPNYFNLMGLYYIYARARNRRATPGADQPFDRVFLFPQIRALLRNAGWRIVRSDGTVHQFPIRPGHDPIIVRVPGNESRAAQDSEPFRFPLFRDGRERQGKLGEDIDRDRCSAAAGSRSRRRRVQSRARAGKARPYRGLLVSGRCAARTRRIRPIRRADLCAPRRQKNPARPANVRRRQSPRALGLRLRRMAQIAAAAAARRRTFSRCRARKSGTATLCCANTVWGAPKIWDGRTACGIACTIRTCTIFRFAPRTTETSRIAPPASSPSSRTAALAGQVRYLPNGVEESFFVPRDYDARQTLRLLFVGSWIDRKGIHYLAEAFALLCSKLPDITLAVAGCMLPEEKIRSSFAPEVRDACARSPAGEARRTCPRFTPRTMSLYFRRSRKACLSRCWKPWLPACPSSPVTLREWRILSRTNSAGCWCSPRNATELAAAMERLCGSRGSAPAIRTGGATNRAAPHLADHRAKARARFAARRRASRSAELKYAVLNLPCVSDTQLQYSSKLVTAFPHSVYAWLGLRPFVAQHTAAEHAALQRWARAARRWLKSGWPKAFRRWRCGRRCPLTARCT